MILGAPSAYQALRRIGALNYHIGQTVVLIRRGKRRLKVDELLEALLLCGTPLGSSIHAMTTPDGEREPCPGTSSGDASFEEPAQANTHVTCRVRSTTGSTTGSISGPRSTALYKGSSSDRR
jgi:hypothetical protein